MLQGSSLSSAEGSLKSLKATSSSHSRRSSSTWRTPRTTTSNRGIIKPSLFNSHKLNRIHAESEYLRAFRMDIPAEDLCTGNPSPDHQVRSTIVKLQVHCRPMRWISCVHVISSSKTTVKMTLMTAAAATGRPVSTSSGTLRIPVFPVLLPSLQKHIRKAAFVPNTENGNLHALLRLNLFRTQARPC
ncbi:hypothetical protein BOTBODRAFT_173243 [Botryobasidium botryosum FD-172 SS1]|uniref:Uncharacterized protein n=1 Tax=Botryobasidium botryosum (strain FD-172 SS1) TaxID=930990 RepID=A0A067MWX8_BOTB1|nr:hypothetical protein BOTBODRAFT_173243 [Botryobasidium botryosum FD-172 SS1]